MNCFVNQIPGVKLVGGPRHRLVSWHELQHFIQRNFFHRLLLQIAGRRSSDFFGLKKKIISRKQRWHGKGDKPRFQDAFVSIAIVASKLIEEKI
jgi:hypothetical protein